MHLLVSGGAGFIGSNFIRYWLKKHPDDFVTNLDVLSYAGNLRNLEEVAALPNYRFVKGDICDKDTVTPLVADCDAVVHFAAESHVDRSIIDSADFIRTNVEGTRVLLDAALKTGKKRFHHVSTDEVFGSLDKDSARFNENTPYDPRSPYSASKAASDHLVRAYFHTHGLPITISNCSNNYGPFHFPEKLIPLCITNILENREIPVYGKGDNIRDWIHVDDHNRGVEQILLHGRVGETYCLGGNNEVKNIDIIKLIIQEMGRGEDLIRYVADRPGHDKRYAIDPSKAADELDWMPEVDFQNGIRDVIRWYEKNQSWWQEIKSGAYKDYYKKQYGN